MKVISVRFYATQSGHEPVLDWLKALTREDRRTVGQDIKTVEIGWPIGMPVVRKLDKGLWEVRSDLTGGRIARVLFTVADGEMVLLHAFIKKSQKTPASDLELAKLRRNDVLRK
ncbi:MULTISPECIES: type II toxin-antitoxin system RelE/ParE family toxin [unclassified Endozoicomonas]|uniref:type II toxin-antitoxin system RelE/ParE family toxin n=1 Tax=unclassified Endozoicomonas TaxID=2644528 RepID=UPI003BB59C0F